MYAMREIFTEFSPRPSFFETFVKRSRRVRGLGEGCGEKIEYIRFIRHWIFSVDDKRWIRMLFPWRIRQVRPRVVRERVVRAKPYYAVRFRGKMSTLREVRVSPFILTFIFQPRTLLTPQSLYLRAPPPSFQLSSFVSSSIFIVKMEIGTKRCVSSRRRCISGFLRVNSPLFIRGSMCCFES